MSDPTLFSRWSMKGFEFGRFMGCALLGVALSAACTPLADLRRHRRVLETFARMEGGHERSLADLDLDLDGEITRSDRAALEELALVWGRALTARGVRIEPLRKLYHGGNKDIGPAVKLLRNRESPVDLADLDETALVALFIETRWMAAQAALVVGRKASPARFGGALVEHVPGYRVDTMEPAAVCAAVEKVDLAPYVAAGIEAPGVMFDLDSTVWPGNVMDPFLAVLIENRLPRPEANAKLAAFLKTVPGIDGGDVDRNDVVENAKLLLVRSTDTQLPAEQKVSTKDAFYNIVALLAGMRVEEAENAARQVYEEGSALYPPWKTRLFADRDGCGMRRIINTLEARGMRAHLLSAGLDVLSRGAAQSLGLPEGRALGSLLEVKDGVYTGAVRDSTYTSKGSVTRQWLAAPPVLAFGDSPQSDFDMMLEAAAAAFMVNPRPAFQERDDKEAGGRFVAVTFDGTERDLGSP